MRGVGLLAVLAASGCGGAAVSAPFSLSGREAGAAAIERVERMARRAEPPAPVAVAVGEGGEGLFAFDARDGRRRWHQPGAVDSVPWLAGRFVVHVQGEQVLLRRLADGVVATRLPRNQLQLIGASGDGPWVVVVLSTGGGVGARSEVVALRDGRETARWRFEQTAGVPLVRGPVAFVPWASQFVSAVLLPEGRVLARVRSGDAQMLQVWEEPDGPMLGGPVAVPWGPGLASGELERAGGFRIRLGELPGRPSMRPDDPSRPPLPPRSAAHRVGLRWWAARQGDRAVLGNGVVFFVFYRTILALEPGEEGPRVRWARRLDQDVVGAVAGPRTLWVALRDGRLVGLCAGQGRLAEVARTKGAPFAYVRLPRGALPRPAFDEQRPSLAAQLAEVAAVRDARTTPVQRMAVQMLGTLSGAEATGALIELCHGRRVTPVVRGAACEALGTRTDGAEAIVAALRGRASFLEDRPAPPLAALARAAVAAGARDAVGLLLEHLWDPATPGEALGPIVRALGALGGASVREPLERFVRFYHAEPGPQELGLAVAAALEELVAVASAEPAEEAREAAVRFVREILDDPTTSAAVGSAIQAWWTVWQAEQAQQAEQAAEAAEGGETEADEPEDGTAEEASGEASSDGASGGPSSDGSAAASEAGEGASSPAGAPVPGGGGGAR